MSRDIYTASRESLSAHQQPEGRWWTETHPPYQSVPGTVGHTNQSPFINPFQRTTPETTLIHRHHSRAPRPLTMKLLLITQSKHTESRSQREISIDLARKTTQSITLHQPFPTHNPRDHPNPSPSLTRAATTDDETFANYTV